MTTITQTEEQLELVSIIELGQAKLIKNFTLLSKKLRGTNQQINTIIQHHSQSINKTNQTIFTLQQSMNEKHDKQQKIIQNLLERIIELQTAKNHTYEQLEQHKQKEDKLNDNLITIQLSIEQKIKQKQNQLAELSNRIEILKIQQQQITKQVNKKQTKIQGEKISKQTQLLKEKNNFIENQLKMANHKLQKMEILSQKAERLQAKKQMQITKQITQKIKNQLRMTNGDRNSGNFQDITSLINNKEQIAKDPIAARRSIMSEENSINLAHIYAGQNLLRGNSEQIMQKMGEKLKYMQIQLRQVNQNLKVLNKGFNTAKKGDGKQTNTQVITEKINEIKPQLIKLWAKVDTVEDRLAFNQKKMQEKFKSIAQLSALIKQNNISRLEQKFKNLQTQIFTSIKQLKTKVESKVSQSDYDKMCRSIQQKIKEINELIYLKSDKLQVKKALLFLQSKIKQIILVISEDEQNEKDALLTKKQIKCISCDKQLDKFSGIVSSPKGNWDSLPYKDHPPEILGRFGMTNFGSLTKKIKKLQNKQLPLLNNKKSVNNSFQQSS